MLLYYYNYLSYIVFTVKIILFYIMSFSAAKCFLDHSSLYTICFSRNLEIIYYKQNFPLNVIFLHKRLKKQCSIINCQLSHSSKVFILM